MAVLRHGLPCGVPAGGVGVHDAELFHPVGMGLEKGVNVLHQNAGALQIIPQSRRIEIQPLVGAVAVSVAFAVHKDAHRAAALRHPVIDGLSHLRLKGKLHQMAPGGQFHHCRPVGGQGIVHTGHLQKFLGHTGFGASRGGDHVHPLGDGGTDGCHGAGRDFFLVVEYGTVQVQRDEPNV